MVEHDRLPMDARTKEEVHQYYTTRAKQLAVYGYKWSTILEDSPGGYKTAFLHTSGAMYDSFYITADNRGKGFGTAALQACVNPIVTVQDCNVETFLRCHNANYAMVRGIHDTAEYKLVEQFYGSRRANRSRVLLMNHIDEGLYIMAKVGASDDAMRAYCLHPMLQDDESLFDNYADVIGDLSCNGCSPQAVVLAVEYRNIANAHLSMRTITNIDQIALSPLRSVNQMLIGDKVQNYKDFILYHKDTHPRSNALDAYFKDWLNRLGVECFDLWMKELQEFGVDDQH